MDRQVGNDEGWIGGQGVVDFQVFLRGRVIILLKALYLCEIVVDFDIVVGLAHGEHSLGIVFVEEVTEGGSRKFLNLLFLIHLRYDMINFSLLIFY